MPINTYAARLLVIRLPEHSEYASHRLLNNDEDVKGRSRGALQNLTCACRHPRKVPFLAPDHLLILAAGHCDPRQDGGVTGPGSLAQPSELGCEAPHFTLGRGA